MPYNSYNKHYTNYRKLRKIPRRNLYKTAYESITGTNISFDYEKTKEDTELTQYRWEVAKTKAIIAFLEDKKKYYDKLLLYPIAISSMPTTYFYTRTRTDSNSECGFSPIEEYHHRKSVLERYQAAIDSWAVWEKEKIGDIRMWNGEVNYYRRNMKNYKEKVRKEYEYMTSGEGHNYYLNELVIEKSLDIHEQMFGERLYYSEIQKQKAARITKQRQAIVKDIRELKRGVQNVYNCMSSNSSQKPYYEGDATKIISSMRKTSKLIKDLEQDLVYFKEAFASEWGKNTVLSAFGNTVEEISKKNPYLEKRILWESLLEDTRVIYNNIIERIGSLEQHLESLGTEEEFVAQQKKRYKLFRQRYERKKEIKRNIEDRKEAKTDQEELNRATALLEQIKKTGYGHDHLSSKGEEKYFYAEFDEAKKAEINMFNQDGRRLDLYAKEISVPYTKWDKKSRRREDRNQSTSGYFHRSFRELKEQKK